MSQRLLFIKLHGQLSDAVKVEHALESIAELATDPCVVTTNYDQVLEEALQWMNQGDSPEQAAAKLRRIPGLSAVADALPRTREEAYAFIALLIALMSLLHQMTDDRSLSQSEVRELIQAMSSDADRPDGFPPLRPTSTFR